MCEAAKKTYNSNQTLDNDKRPTSLFLDSGGDHIPTLQQAQVTAVRFRSQQGESSTKNHNLIRTLIK